MSRWLVILTTTVEILTKVSAKKFTCTDCNVLLLYYSHDFKMFSSPLSRDSRMNFLLMNRDLKIDEQLKACKRATLKVKMCDVGERTSDLRCLETLNGGKFQFRLNATSIFRLTYEIS